MGISILNPHPDAIHARLDLFAADGTLIETAWETIEAKRRIARVITEYFDSIYGKEQVSGYVRVTTSRPAASFSLFGSKDLSVLSAIPAQAIQ